MPYFKLIDCLCCGDKWQKQFKSQRSYREWKQDFDDGLYNEVDDGETEDVLCACPNCLDNMKRS